MYWALVLYKDLKKNKSKINSDNKEKIDDNKEKICLIGGITSDCIRCGQNKYFCQCISLNNFNPEKDIY